MFLAKRSAALRTFLIFFFCCSCQGMPDVSTVEVLPHSETRSIAAKKSAESDQTESSGFTIHELETLRSIKRLDDYPLYSMRYFSDYAGEALIDYWTASDMQRYFDRSIALPMSFGCSLFASFGGSEPYLYGRNFDWRFSPAVILFTDPPDGFASLTMVDIQYLVGVEKARNLDGLDLVEIGPLLQAPYWPFDGMNERGLAIGMAAVPESELPYNPSYPTTGSLEIMRKVLDQAETVPEAIEVFETHNLDMLGGPWLHYLVADSHGEAALIEFVDGQLRVYPNREGWQHATNFLHSHHIETLSGVCPRYDWIQATLSSVDGTIDTEGALTLLQEVSQGGQASSTQWSVIYNMTDLEILIVMGRDYPQVHRITFESFSR